MKNEIEKYKILKSELKRLNKELKEKLLEDSEYSEFADDSKASSEVLRSHRKNLIEQSPTLGVMSQKIQSKKGEIKILHDYIMGGVMIVEKNHGEQLSFNFTF